MISFRIEKFDEVTSTNTLLLERAKQGAPEGLVLTAQCQSAGRGKPGRQWLSPKGKNLLCSILLRPPLSQAKAPMLTQVACRAIAKVLKEKYDIASEFKRPNDVMVGLNVNSEASELPPEGISMGMLKNSKYSIDEVLGHILDEFGTKCIELYKN